MIIFQTADKSKAIKNTINALLRSGSITSAHKIQYAKHYTLSQEGKITTQNTQLLLVQETDKRTKTGPKILDRMLTNWSETLKDSSGEPGGSPITTTENV